MTAPAADLDQPIPYRLTRPRVALQAAHVAAALRSIISAVRPPIDDDTVIVCAPPHVTFTGLTTVGVEAHRDGEVLGAWRVIVEEV